MNIEKRFKTRYYCRRRKQDKIEWVVVHYTGTAASALANARAIEKELKEPRSTHYFVEDERIINVVPEELAAWHVGGEDKPDTPPEKRKKRPVYNRNSIGVDLCEDKMQYDKAHRSVEDKDWFFHEETEAAAAELIADIMKRHNISISHVVRHYDVTGKWCPRPFVGDDTNQAYKESGNERWRKFLVMIEMYRRGEMK